MKKKSIIKLFVASLGLFGVTSCDFLDVLPDSRTKVDNEDKITKLLVTAYPMNQPIVLFENMSDNVHDNGPRQSWNYSTQQESYLYKDISTVSTDSPYDLWEGYYKAISTANSALKAIDELGNPENLSPQRAEALMCRAFSHLWLTHIFCQAYNTQSSGSDLGIPYITEPETTVTVKYQRGTVAEVYKKINEDIENALPYIEDRIYVQPKWHFNKKAAYGFAAEFNLYYGNYQKAIEYANVALGNKPQLRDLTAIESLSIATDISNTYHSDNNRANLLIIPTISRFGRQVNSSSYRRYMHTKEICEFETYKSPGPWQEGRVIPAASVYLRGFRNFGSTEYSNFFPKNLEIFEYTDPVARTGYPYVVWVPVTVDKVLLTRAEAYVMNGQLDLAAEDLCLWYSAYDKAEIRLGSQEIIDWYKEAIKTTNRVVKDINPRWDFTIAKESDQYAMLMAVLHARRIEGIHEGIRWIDVKRMGIEVVHEVAYGTPLVIKPYDLRIAIQIPDFVAAAGLEKNPR